jgi:hypothetical protein
MVAKVRYRLGWAALAIAIGVGVVPVARAVSLDEVARDTEALKESVAELHGGLTDRAELSGYYDFEYFNGNRDGHPSHFDQHHVSLFVSHTWKEWRFFAELEWEHGAELEDDGGTGGVLVESAWAEYLHADWLKVRGGKLLLPQYWNVNHYPNVVLSTERPLMVREIYPGDGTGLMFYGTAYAGDMGATYRLYVTNGEDRVNDDDNNGKAVGGRVTVHLAGLAGAFRRCDLGVSGYHENAPSHGGSDDIYGFDAQINTARFELLAEFASETEDGETNEGFYVQPSARVYREVRLFYRYGYVDAAGIKHTRHTAGVNFRPMHNVSLKIEANDNEVDHGGTTEDWQGMATSVAIFF